MPPALPDVHFGTVSETEEIPAPPAEEEDDEEADEDAPAAEDLIELLGLDPDDLEEEETAAPPSRTARDGRRARAPALSKFPQR